MRLLLDENLPKRLKSDFPDHEVFTVAERQWRGYKNGDLLKLMLDNDFAALLTFDKNLQHQQNFQKFPITVFILSAPSNTYQDLTALTGQINSILNKSPLRIGPIIISK